MRIAEFINDKMGCYIDGGTNAKTTAYFTCEELEAIYNGMHYNRDKSWAMQLTPLPENIAAPAAMTKCDQTLAEILKIFAESSEKGPTMNTETIREDTYGKASGNMPREGKINGLEGLKNYVTRKPS